MVSKVLAVKFAVATKGLEYKQKKYNLFLARINLLLLESMLKNCKLQNILIQPKFTFMVVLGGKIAHVCMKMPLFLLLLVCEKDNAIRTEKV